MYLYIFISSVITKTNYGKTTPMLTHSYSGLNSFHFVINKEMTTGGIL